MKDFDFDQGLIFVKTLESAPESPLDRLPAAVEAKARLSGR